MAKAKKPKWNDPVHPGEILAEELEYMRLTTAIFAQEIGIAEKHLSQIIDAKNDITPDIAKRLGKYFKGTAKLWQNLQKDYEFDIAKNNIGKNLPQIKFYKSVAEMTLKRGKVHVTPFKSSLWSETGIVYVWATAKGKCLRVGTATKMTLEKRLLSYARDISLGLQGKSRYTSHMEALCWKKLIERNESLLAFAYQPPEIETIVGRLRPVLDIERVLIEKSKPCLNRSHR